MSVKTQFCLLVPRGLMSDYEYRNKLEIFSNFLNRYDRLQDFKRQLEKSGHKGYLSYLLTGIEF